jgi:hypothetical protein
VSSYRSCSRCSISVPWLDPRSSSAQKTSTSIPSVFRTSFPLSQTIITNTLACLGLNSQATEAVGIDISCHALHSVTVSSQKLATVHQTNPQSHIDHDASDTLRRAFAWESRATSTFLQQLPNATTGRSGPTTQQLTNIVRKYLPRQADCGTRIASAVLPPVASVLRWPNAEQPAELTKSIRTDLGHAFATGDSIETCSWSIGDSGRKMIYAVSGGMTSALATEMTRLGFKSPIVDSRPHALARAAGLDAVNDANIIIEWSWSDCTLLITTQQKHSTWRLPQLCRPLHGYALSSNDRIGPHSNTSRPNLRSHDKGPNYLPLFRAAAEEIQRTLRFAEALHGVDPTGPILLCGPAAAIPAAPQILSEALDREFRPWSWCGSLRPTQHSQEPIDALFAVAIGAACGTLA